MKTTNKYNVTIDKNLVYASQMNRVKNAVKQFQHDFTLKDVLSMVSPTIQEICPYVSLFSEDVLRMDIEFFGGNTYAIDDDYSDINMRIEFFSFNIREIYQITLYCNYIFDITHKDLVRIDVYTR